MITSEELARVPALEGLSQETLSWLAEEMEEVLYEEGDIVIRAGDPAEWLFVLLEGQIRAVVDDPAGNRPVFVTNAGEVTGMLPHSRLTTFPGSARASMPSRGGRLHIRHFPEIAQHYPDLETRLAHVMIDRTRSTARAQLHQEKLASLGTMAAGLAHELNNPASAARRTARELSETLQAFDEHASSMLKPVMFPHAQGEGDPFKPVYEILESEPPELDAITRSDREDELASWLEEQGVPEPWDAASTLVSVGMTREFLEDFSRSLIPERVCDFLRWLPRDVSMRQLAEELVQSTMRISELVLAMKSYTFMGQANEKQPVDLHAGIENTLTILAHKLKRRAVEVERDFGDIPPVPAHGGELNQVWTNLLDNAIAAVPESDGRIVIRTTHDPAERRVIVDIEDNGSGIPEDIQNRIFEPFFTTKDVGEGTGLGLDISYRIVTARHGGRIEVTSRPGRTLFRVRLPTGEPGSNGGTT